MNDMTSYAERAKKEFGMYQMNHSSPCPLPPLPLSVALQVPSGRMLACVKGAHYRRIGAITVSGDDATVVTAGDDALVRVWSLVRCAVVCTGVSHGPHV